MRKSGRNAVLAILLPALLAMPIMSVRASQAGDDLISLSPTNVNQPGSNRAFSLEVHVNYANDLVEVTSGQVIINYDPTVLDPDGLGYPTAGYGAQFDVQKPGDTWTEEPAGRLFFSYIESFDPNVGQTGEGHLASISFRILSTCAAGAKNTSPLDIQSPTATDPDDDFGADCGDD